MFMDPSGITAALPAEAPDGTYAIQNPFRYAVSTPIA